MPRKKKSTSDQIAEEARILNAPIDESIQAVKGLMSEEFVQMSNLDASQIALMLQELVRGNQSLLANSANQGIEIARLRERQDHADQEIATRLAEQQKFIEETLDKAESLRRTGLEHDKLIINGANQYAEARNKAAANYAVKSMAFKQKMLNEEKEIVVSPGQLITAMEHGQQVARIIPEEVRIKTLVWVLQPGVPTSVPKTVADLLRQRRASQLETRKRAELLGKNLESSKLADEWGKIDGTPTETMPR